MPTGHAVLDHLDSNRRFVHPDGIGAADVVFVPLEDGIDAGRWCDPAGA